MAIHGSTVPEHDDDLTPAPASEHPSDASALADQRYRDGLAAEARGDLPSAVASYKDAVTARRSHINAIAALGRLRFVAPEQPLLNDLRNVTPRVCEVIVEVRNPCNYRCFYCVAQGHNDEPVRPFDFDHIEAIYQGIKADLIYTQF